MLVPEAAASASVSGMSIPERRSTTKLELRLPPTPPASTLEISEADTLHDRDRNSMGSIGVCGDCTARAPAPAPAPALSVSSK